jgi:hypothetical protein
MVNMTKPQLEKENQELRDHVAELEAQLKGPRRSQSDPDLHGRQSVRLSPTPSTLLRNYPPPQSPSPPPSRSPSPPPAQVAPKDLKLDPPPEFNGKTTEYATFIGHCEFYFMNKPVTFGKNDANKVNFAISRLRGHPSTWAHSLLRANPNNPTLKSWSLFRAELDTLYADPFYMEQVRRDLDALEQKGSARTFAAEFKTLAAIRNLPDDEKIFQFKKKLKGTVQTQLAGLLSIDETFDSLVHKAILVDQALFNADKAAKKAAKSQNSGSSSSSSRPPQQPQHQPRNNSSSSSGGSRNPGFSGGSHSSTTPGSRTPSSTPHPPLSEAEKQYREDNNLCRFCGGPHFKKDCEELKKKLEREAKKGLPPRYPTPASSSNVNAFSASPVTVSHIISPAGKFNPQSH